MIARGSAVARRGLRPDLYGAVFDRWWPHRVGTVVKRLKTRLHVRWSDGEIWRYDQAHTQFLQLYRPGSPRTAFRTKPADA